MLSYILIVKPIFKICKEEIDKKSGQANGQVDKPMTLLFCGFYLSQLLFHERQQKGVILDDMG